MPHIKDMISIQILILIAVGGSFGRVVNVFMGIKGTRSHAIIKKIFYKPEIFRISVYMDILWQFCEDMAGDMSDAIINKSIDKNFIHLEKH